MMAFDPGAVADALDGAEAACQTLVDLPDPLRPRSEAEAYAVQDAIVRRSGPIGGWKITIDADGRPSTCAPLLSRRMVANAGRMPLGAGLAIEVELALRFGRAPVETAGGFTASDVGECIACGHIAYEVLSSRFRDRKAMSRLTTLADCQSHGAAVIGDGLDWGKLDLAVIEMTLEIDGQVAGTGRVALSKDRYCSALAWLARHARERNLGLKAGDVVLTGARIGSLPISRAGTVVRATSPQLGAVTLTFT